MGQREEGAVREGKIKVEKNMVEGGKKGGREGRGGGGREDRGEGRSARF